MGTVAEKNPQIRKMPKGNKKHGKENKSSVISLPGKTHLTIKRTHTWLISNNMKLQLSGHKINHPKKCFAKLWRTDKKGTTQVTSNVGAQRDPQCTFIRGGRKKKKANEAKIHFPSCAGFKTCFLSSILRLSKGGIYAGNQNGRDAVTSSFFFFFWSPEYFYRDF